MGLPWKMWRKGPSFKNGLIREGKLLLLWIMHVLPCTAVDLRHLVQCVYVLKKLKYPEPLTDLLHIKKFLYMFTCSYKLHI